MFGWFVVAKRRNKDRFSELRTQCPTFNPTKEQDVKPWLFVSLGPFGVARPAGYWILLTPLKWPGHSFIAPDGMGQLFIANTPSYNQSVIPGRSQL
jgi:hypothetical protein